MPVTYAGGGDQRSPTHSIYGTEHYGIACIVDSTAIAQKKKDRGLIKNNDIGPLPLCMRKKIAYLCAEEMIATKGLSPFAKAKKTTIMTIRNTYMMAMMMRKEIYGKGDTI